MKAAATAAARMNIEHGLRDAGTMSSLSAGKVAEFMRSVGSEATRFAIARYRRLKRNSPMCVKARSEITPKIGT